MDFNATTHGVRDIDDNRLSNLIERISEKRLGLGDVEADIIGRSYECLIRKFAEGEGQSAGEFYTPGEIGEVMALIMDPEPGMTCYGSAGLLIKCELALEEKIKACGKKNAGIGNTFNSWNEVTKYSRIVKLEEIAKNDFNISPSRYIHTGAGEEYRSIAEIVEELDDLENEERQTSLALRQVLAALRV